MGRNNYIILFICRYGGDSPLQILYSVGMVWGGLITLSCLFVGMGDILHYRYSILLAWPGEKTNHIILFICRYGGESPLQYILLCWYGMRRTY